MSHSIKDENKKASHLSPERSVRNDKTDLFQQSFVGGK
jgi:hypothetical protein